MRINQDFKNEPAVVIDHGFGLSNEKKTPFCWFEFEFLEMKGPNDEPVTVRADVYITDKTMDYALQKFSALGWNGKSVTELDPNEPDAYNFKGAKAYITGEMQLAPNGNKYPKVNFINATPAGVIASIDKKELSEIDKKLRGKIAAYRTKNPPVARPVFDNMQPVNKTAEGLPF